jgi:hypothetical protein
MDNADSKHINIIPAIKHELSGVRAELEKYKTNGISEEEAQDLIKWLENIEGMVKAASITKQSSPKQLANILIGIANTVDSQNQQCAMNSLRHIEYELLTNK